MSQWDSLSLCFTISGPPPAPRACHLMMRWNISAKRGRAPAHEQATLEEAEELLLPVAAVAPAGLDALGRVEVHLSARERNREHDRGDNQALRERLRAQ